MMTGLVTEKAKDLVEPAPLYTERWNLNPISTIETISITYGLFFLNLIEFLC